MKRLSVSLLAVAIVACTVFSGAYAQGQSKESNSQPEQQTVTAETDSSDLLTALEERQNYSMLVNALKKANASELIGEESFTLFAPTNRAIEKMETPVSEMKSDDLKELLRNHLILKQYSADQLARRSNVENVLGTKLEIGNEGKTIEGAQITDRNVEVKNGIVHGIDSVITLPSRSAKAAADSTDF